ncbi:hypothetical protein IAS59_004678 [Cryptococcus gattii]
MEYLGRRDPSLVEKSANLGLPGKQALMVLICYFFHQLTIPQNSSEILSQTLYKYPFSNPNLFKPKQT